MVINWYAQKKRNDLVESVSILFSCRSTKLHNWTSRLISSKIWSGKKYINKFVPQSKPAIMFCEHDRKKNWFWLQRTMTIGLDCIDFLIAQNTHQPLHFLVHQFYNFWNCFTRMLAKINVSFNCVMLQTNNCKQNLTDEFGNSMKIQFVKICTPSPVLVTSTILPTAYCISPEESKCDFGCSVVDTRFHNLIKWLALIGSNVPSTASKRSKFKPPDWNIGHNWHHSNCQWKNCPQFSTNVRSNSHCVQELKSKSNKQ